MMIGRLDETIVAVSSAPGVAPVGIVRLSGDSAINMAANLLHTGDRDELLNTAGGTRMKCEIRVGDSAAWPAYASVFRGPHSYTGQDLVELFVPGGPVIVQGLTRRAVRLGAEPAQPGEFTARAFLNGRLSLADAQAVNSSIHASTDTQLRAARHVRESALSQRLSAVRTSIASLLALVEADIDFSEEPIEFVSPSSLVRRLTDISDRLSAVSRCAISAERLGVVPRVLLLGPSNAGKSSLMNRLTGLNRSICSAATGTTRDILTAPVKLPSGEVMLMDAAGLDESAESLLRRGGDLALQTAGQVDAVLVVVDVADLPSDSLVETILAVDRPKTLVVANKCDLLTDGRASQVVEKLGVWRLGPVVLTSAKTGAGLDTLRLRLSTVVGLTATSVAAEAFTCCDRQRAALQQSFDAIDRARCLAKETRETIDCADLVAFELRESTDALGEFLGETCTESLLSEIFANFCIGK